jgi:uncharacterized protein
MTATLIEEPKRTNKKVYPPARNTQHRKRGLGGRIAGFVAAIQTLLFVGHLFVYKTWMFFSLPATRSEARAFEVALALLSVSFVAASLLAFRFDNPFVRVFYSLSAAWLGVLNYLVIGAIACWAIYGAQVAFGLPFWRPEIVAVLFGAAILVALFGIVNASWVRVRRITVRLEGLPAAWRNRTAALLTDLHLGHVRSRGFMARIVNLIRDENPDIVFIAGDLYDGGKSDPEKMVAPWKQFSPPFGTYFVTGNHEGFSNPSRYLEAVRQAGIRALENERVDVDGLQILGVSYRDSTDPQRFESILHDAELDRRRASILLLHVPHGLAITASRGVTLQLSGHTHNGQLFPFTWFTRRVFGQFTYGLNRFGGLTIYTSSGAGTWGPPLRVGTRPEIVLIGFE